MEITLVIGGCRSGKSRHALELAEGFGDRKTFVATCEARDDEMRRRVAAHRLERGDSWQTLEAPLDLAGALRAAAPRADVVLVDCLTLWASNLILAEKDSEALSREVSELVDAAKTAECPVILVTNEVGAGIVPENRLARHYRDEVGRINQRVAAAADRVIWMVAGIPVTVKP